MLSPAAEKKYSSFPVYLRKLFTLCLPILLFQVSVLHAGEYSCRVINIYPHDPSAFTQGLIYHNGYLYESTGNYGASSIRKVDVKTGRVLKKQHLPKRFFGEGLVLEGNRLIQLTWKSKTGFVYDVKDLEKTGEFRYPTEGWGITTDGKSLIMSDGSDSLLFLDRNNFKFIRSVKVREMGQAIYRINELEYVDGLIYANIWRSDSIAVISPASGKVKGWINLKGILAEKDRYGIKTDVLNGIAYDAKGKRLFVTGKLWPKLFEIEVLKP